MIGICPNTGKTLTGKEQLLSRLSRLTRTVKTSIPKLRGYGSSIRDHLGKTGSLLRLTSLQNVLLSEINDPVNGFQDFKCEQVKVLPSGSIYILGKLNNERTEINI